MCRKQNIRCKVIGCINQKKNPPPKTGMFLVPNSAPREVFEKWVQLTGNEELCEVPVDHLKRNLRICEQHFRPDQMSPPTSNIKRLLKRGIVNVVPTRFSDDHVPINSERIHQWRQSEHYRKAIWNNASQPPAPKCIQSKASDFSSNEVPTRMQETASLACLSKSGGKLQESLDPQNGQLRRTIFVRCISINGIGQNIGPLLESLE